MSATVTEPAPDKQKVAVWSELEDRKPAYALASGVDLVVLRYDDQVSVLYGRCLHRGALMADGYVDGRNLICGVHSWDYCYDTGVSEYNDKEALHKFEAWVDEAEDAVYVDLDEVRRFEKVHPQLYRRDEYLGLYVDTHGTGEEPHTKHIQTLAVQGPDGIGHHGPVAAMGVPGPELPRWDDIQILTAQLARMPLLEDREVGTEFVLGPRAAKPLRFEIPIFVSDMSYGALSEEAKVALAKGAGARRDRHLLR